MHALAYAQSFLISQIQIDFFLHELSNIAFSANFNRFDHLKLTENSVIVNYICLTRLYSSFTRMRTVDMKVPVYWIWLSTSPMLLTC